MPIKIVCSADWSLISADSSQKFICLPKVERVPRHSREPTGIADIFSYKHFN